MTIRTFLVAVGFSALAAGHAQAEDKSLTLCWAAWDPANALVELGKDFTAQSGIKMNYEFVPWTSYADRFLNELNTKSKHCDLIIGDSQWIGGSAENGHYVKLNEFFGMAQEHAELLGVARDGGCGGLDVSEGLVLAPRPAGRVQEDCRPRPRAAQDL